MSTAVKPKGPRQVPANAAPAAWAGTYLASTVGAKVLVAVTGLLLTGFVVFHMIGNFKVFFGREEINAYAEFLKHSLGPYLWIARAGLLLAFLAHIGLVIRLKTKTAAARPVPYVAQRAAQATLSSRTMFLTGLVILAFTVYHLAHYTAGVVKPATFPVPVTAADPSNPAKLRVVPAGESVAYLDLREPRPDGTHRHDVYNMVVAGFTTPWVSVAYLIAQMFLFAHLAHGIQSTIQTLGLKGTRFGPVWSAVGTATAALVTLGNAAIVAAVWAGALPIAAATAG